MIKKGFLIVCFLVAHTSFAIDIPNWVPVEFQNIYSRIASSGINIKSVERPLYFYFNNRDGLKKSCNLLMERNLPHDKDLSEVRKDLLQGVRNERWLVAIDYTLHSKVKRGYLIDMNSGELTKFWVSHGKGSDASHSGIPTKFTNISGRKTSLSGLFLTGITGRYKNNSSVVFLHGLETDNNGAFRDGKYSHGAEYVSKSFVNRVGKLGRSWGCPAVRMEYSFDLHEIIKDGAVWYHYTPNERSKGLGISC